MGDNSNIKLCNLNIWLLKNNSSNDCQKYRQFFLINKWLVINQTERTTPRLLIPFSLINCFYWISIISSIQCNSEFVIVTFVNSESNGIFTSELTFIPVILFESTRSMLCFNKGLIRYYPFVCFRSIINESSNLVYITEGHPLFNYALKKPNTLLIKNSFKR